MNESSKMCYIRLNKQWSWISSVYFCRAQNRPQQIVKKPFKRVHAVTGSFNKSGATSFSTKIHVKRLRLGKSSYDERHLNGDVLALGE